MILEAALIATLAQDCAPRVAPDTMQALLMQESSGNPYAIGVVGSPLASQPITREEAITTAKALIEGGYNISLGLGQINYKNLPGLNMQIEDAFDYCKNVQAADEILSTCFVRATDAGKEGQDALQAALSCYYSNNFTTGLKREPAFGNTSYVERVTLAHSRLVPSIGGGNSNQPAEEIKKPEAIENVIEESHNGWDVFKDF